MSNKKARAQLSKVVDGPITGKDIFYAFFPEGFKCNPQYDADIGGNQLPFYVQCGVSTCKRHTLSTTTSNYTNAVNHIRTHFGANEIKTLVRESRICAGAAVANNDTPVKKQSALLGAFKVNPTTTQDHALHTWMKLVCIHNVPITKLQDKDFASLLNCEGTSYGVFVDTMLQLSLIVEKKIASEMAGKKGIIMHDGWSKFSRHYLAIMASYLVPTDKRDRRGLVIMEPVITLLTCTTLPQLEEDNDDDADSEFNICFVFLFIKVVSRFISDASFLSLLVSNGTPDCNNF